MPLVPVIVIEFDDNSPPEASAFTSEPSAWNLANDWSLQPFTGPEVFRAVHRAIVGPTARGYPEHVARSTLEYFDARYSDDEVSWISGGELLKCHNSLPTGEVPPEKSIRLLFEVVAVFVRYYGDDRVRLVFAFSWNSIQFIPE